LRQKVSGARKRMKTVEEMVAETFAVYNSLLLQ